MLQFDASLTIRHLPPCVVLAAPQRTSHETGFAKCALGKAIESGHCTNGADPKHLMPRSGHGNGFSPAIRTRLPAAKPIVQSVRYSLSQIVSDPFVLGRISATHAFSDLYASPLPLPHYQPLAIIKSYPKQNLSIFNNQLTQDTGWRDH